MFFLTLITYFYKLRNIYKNRIYKIYLDKIGKFLLMIQKILAKRLMTKMDRKSNKVIITHTCYSSDGC